MADAAPDGAAVDVAEGEDAWVGAALDAGRVVVLDAWLGVLELECVLVVGAVPANGSLYC